MDNFSVNIENLTKAFPISNASQMVDLGKVLLGKKPNLEQQTGRKIAVDDASFHIGQGESVGIIGHNGAGKSTLLHLIAGMIDPTAGKVNVNGHVNCIMTLGIGLKEELTGRENIYIDGEVQGKTHAQVDEVIDDIIEFAELGKFIDRPLHTYSSGMKARLAFSMITTIEPEILIIDEALGAGDAQFGAKAAAKMREICNKGKILILVSHSMATIREMCTRCIWIDQGKIQMDGHPDEVTEAYTESVHQLQEQALLKQFKRHIQAESYLPGVEITHLSFADGDKKQRAILNTWDNCSLQFSIQTKTPIQQPDFRLRVERTDGIMLLDRFASDDGFEAGLVEGQADFEIPFDPLRFGKKTYFCQLELLDGKGPAGKVLAKAGTILQVDNPDYEHENPLYWWPVNWTLETTSNVSKNSGDK